MTKAKQESTKDTEVSDIWEDIIKSIQGKKKKSIQGYLRVTQHKFK